MPRSPQLGANDGGTRDRASFVRNQGQCEPDSSDPGLSRPCARRGSRDDQLPGRFENLICTEGLDQHGVRAQALREAKSVSGPKPPSSMADQDRLRGLCVAETERMMSLPPPLHGCRTDDASMARRSIASTFGSASTSAEGSRMKRFTLPEPKRM